MLSKIAKNPSIELPFQHIETYVYSMYPPYMGLLLAGWTLNKAHALPPPRGTRIWDKAVRIGIMFRTARPGSIL